MRMYLEANRPDSARRLWEKLPNDYSSVWIRYNAALLEYVSWNILKEPGSSQTSATSLLIQALRSNVYCAYMLAFHETFHQVMEYTEDVEDAPDASLEQAIEYCNSDAMGDWAGTDGALEWIKDVILNALNSDGTNGEDSEGKGNQHEKEENDEDSGSDSDNGSKEKDAKKTLVLTGLTKQDLEWEKKLAKAEKEYEEAMEEDKEDDNETNEQSENDGETHNDKQDGDEAEEEEEEDDDDDEVDFLMYCGMFRTGMDMLSDNGALSL